MAAPCRRRTHAYENQKRIITMELIQTVLKHKIVLPRKKDQAKFPALILLHGRGASEDDLLGLSEYLDERFMFIAPRAPFPFHSGGGHTWYDVLEVGKPEPKMFADSYERLTRFLEDVRRSYPVDPSKVFLLGFSMGTMMSYSLALTMPDHFVAVVANSGYIPEGTDLVFQWEKMKTTSFFIAHGVYDPVIPVQFGKRAKELLEKHEIESTYREYDMGHQINEESLGDIATWLTGKLTGQRKRQPNNA
jgi:phospholipase/carboxylesterase